MKDILISSSVLILAVLLLRFLFRKAISRRVQYALWLLVLLRLLIPVSLGGISWSVASAAQEARRTEVGELASAVSRLDVPRMSYGRAYDEVMAEYRAREIDVSTLGDSELDTSILLHMRSGITVLGVLRSIWYVGIAVTALLLLWQNLRFARFLRRTRVRLEGAESRYPVYLCDDIPSPCLFGLFQPSIYVTSAAAKDKRTLSYVIAHEETHGRQLDHLWALLRSLCLALWWFDPLVWLAAHFSRIDGELACDEGVLARLGEEARIPYGETLLALVPQGQKGNPMLAATTMTAGKKQMRDRIKRIAEHRRPLVIALIAALILAGVVCACTFAGAKKEPEPEPTPLPPVQSATPGNLTVPTPEPTPELSLTDRLGAAADRVFGTYEQPGTDYHISVEADGRRDEYAVKAHNAAWTVESSEGYFLKNYYRWESLEEGEIAALKGEAAGGAVVRIWTEQDSFEVLEESNALLWTEEDGTEHWLRPTPIGNNDLPLYDDFMRYAMNAESNSLPGQAAVPGTVTEYAEVAWQISEQYAALLLDRPAWSRAVPNGAEARFISLFDAYYGEDFPNFCFNMTLLLDLDESNMGEFMAGPGAERIEGEKYAGWDHLGWYRWWSQVTVGLVDGQWRILDMGSGGANVWLPDGVGWAFPEEDALTTEQLVELYFLTWGQTQDWRLLRTLAQKPTEEIRAEMDQLSDEERYTLLRGMERYNKNYGDILDYAASFDPDAYPYEIEFSVYRFMGEVAGYGNDTLCIRVTDPLDSPLPVGFEMYAGLGAVSYEEDYPIGCRLEVTYSGVMLMDEQGYYGLDGGTLTVRRVEE